MKYMFPLNSLGKCQADFEAIKSSCTLYTVYCTVYSIQCTLYGVQYTVYSINTDYKRENGPVNQMYQFLLVRVM